MNNANYDSGQSGDLFGARPARRSLPQVKRSLQPEMTVARALCRQLPRKRAHRDKQRIAHLICLNLLSMLRRDS